MMGAVLPETCWAYKKYNKIISGIQLVFILQLSQWCTVKQTSYPCDPWDCLKTTTTDGWQQDGKDSIRYTGKQKKYKAQETVYWGGWNIILKKCE